MRLTFLLIIYMFSRIGLGQNYSYAQPSQSNDGWTTAHAFESGIDSTLVYALFNKLQSIDHDLHSVLLVKSGELVIEEYFDSFDTDTPHDWRSVTKSIYSLLMGQAIEKGFVKSLDDPFLKYLDIKPEKNHDERKEQITIRHLLTMCSGLDCNDWDKTSKGQEDRVYRQKDWLQYSLDLPLVRVPGDSSFYCTAGVTLAAEVIVQASGMSIDEFADKYLFRPLGITKYRWDHTSSNKNIPSSAMRIYMTPRDMAKIGQLVLDSGQWKGKQLVAAQWIQDMTTQQVKLAGAEYGFLWWTIPIKYKDSFMPLKCATGNGGQYIMIMEELNCLAIFTGGAYNSAEDKFPFGIVRDILIPSLNLPYNVPQKGD